MICQHCQEAPASRPRRLCWTCYYVPGVKELYPSMSKFGRRSFGNGHVILQLPATPTRAEPGSPEKLAILEERARRLESLFHPRDRSLLPRLIAG